MKLLKKCGGNLIKGTILFSHHDEYLFVCQGSDVLILDGKTCRLLGRLDSGQQSGVAPIVALALHPTVKGELFTGSEDGIIRRWQYEGGKCLGTLNLGRRIVGMLSTQNGSCDSIFILSRTLAGVGEQNNGRGHGEIWKLDMADVNQPEPFHLAFQVQKAHPLAALSLNGQRMAVVKKGAVHVWNIVEDPWRQKVVKFKVPAAPVQLAIHPTDPIIYFADKMGKIYTYNLANQCEVEKMHWHPRAPLTLEMTPDGRHLLSGGEECVMVVWDVEQSERQFFPHLGAHVLGAISNNTGDYYAILLRHNSVLLVSPSLMKPIGRYDGVRSLPKQCKIGLVKDPRVPSAVFLNAIPGQIQSFDPIRDCTFDGDIDVCQQNIVGRGKKGKGLIYSDVYHVAFSADGNWMATYDRRMTDIRRLHHDVLRFWRRRKGGQYQVYTAFDVPHNEPINKIVFRPTRIGGLYQCATVGADGKVKVWTNSARRVLKVTDDGKAVAQITWENKASVTHKTLRCNSAAYSKDGSVLAVGFGKVIRLLDPDTLELLGSLQTFGGQSDIQQVLIVGDYLIGTDASKIYVWNLASMEIIWTLAISTSCLKIHPEGELFSVATLVENTSIVLMFSPCSPVPVQCHRHTLPIRDIEFVSVEWRSEPVLVLLDAQNLLHVMSMTSNVTLPVVDEATPYDLRRKEVAAQLATSLVTNPEERPVVLAPTKPVKMNCINMAKLLLADVPSHLLPNTLDLFEHFIMHQKF